MGFEELLGEIAGDHVHGARYLSMRSLEALRLVVEEAESESVEALMETLRRAGRRLMEARPGMACIANQAAKCIYELAFAASGMGLEDLKGYALSRIDGMIKEVESTGMRAAHNGSRLIGDGVKVMSCSYSSTIRQVLSEAWRAERRFKAYVAESLSVHGRGLSYGRLMAEELRREGLDVEIIPDGEISVFVDEADLALVGADMVKPDGSIVNGTPTFSLAYHAWMKGKPFHVICETYKFDARSLLGIEAVLEEGFDLVPGRWITEITTERGPVKPWEARDICGEFKAALKLLLDPERDEDPPV
ncbi:MAG: hypothetical protein QW638_08435 [Candidatus Bathyarchaeia archaeon]